MFGKISLLLGLLPALIGLIRAVEDAIPGHGEGEKKLAMVREMLELVSGIDSAAVGDSLISGIVAALNRGGVLRGK